MNAVAAGLIESAEQTHAVRIAAAQQCRTTGSADRLGYIKVREPRALFRQRIKIRCFYRTIVAAEVGPTQVIGEQHNHIGSVFGEEDTCRKHAEKGKQRFHDNAV